MEEFYHTSYFYPYLLDLNNCVTKVQANTLWMETVLTTCQMIDLGDLWYREFYLELSKKTQFPIAMSLPWLLTDSILGCFGGICVFE